MPRVHKRKARKDYPEAGIKKGDEYYYTKLRLQRGGLVKRSLRPFKPSELTNSPFKAGWLSAQEGWDESDKGVDAIEAAEEAIRELGDEARGSFDNMPEGLQMGETGQQIEARAEGAEDVSNTLEDLKTQMDDLTTTETPEEPDDDEAPDFLEKTDAWETYQDELQEYESEMERIQVEVEDALANMPD